MSASTHARVVLKWIGITIGLAAMSGVGLHLAGAADPAAAPSAAPAAPPAAPVVTPAATPDEPAEHHALPPLDVKGISAALGLTGELKNGVYHVTVPRDDLNVNVEGMFIPTEAGLASVFHFWVCPCGKTVVYGEFCLADYEANDVIDALRVSDIRVTSAANLLIGENPKLMGVRFYCEGDPIDLAKAIKSALRYTGDARNAKQPLND